jgi:DNA topoisomerase-2
MSEENKILILNHSGEIMERYINVRLKYLGIRKGHQIRVLQDDIKLMVSKYKFITAVVEERLKITKRPTADIINDIEELEHVIKHNGSYDYLLDMSLRSITQEKADELMNKIKKYYSDLKELKEKTVQDIWLEELK